MKLPRSRIVRRRAFTLIELLVVIAIIATLASILLAAIFKALATAKMVQNRNDITQLEAAVANFKQAFQVDYLPSYLNPQDPNTPAYLQRLYPQAMPNWAGGIAGNQALVFFLSGGLPGSPTFGKGFSSDPTQPMLPPQQPGEQRKGPFYDFPANRIVNGYFVDVYGTPFAYFSTTGTPNSYPPGPNGNSYVGGKGPTGCPLGAYMEPGKLAGGSTAYLKPDTCQIISAGANMLFNQGNVWPGVTNPIGFDDISNFATSVLGSGQ